MRISDYPTYSHQFGWNAPDTPEGTVYKVQCVTSSIMRQITGVGNVSRVDMGEGIPKDPRFIFRILPAYRGPDSLALRKQVAEEVRRVRLLKNPQIIANSES